MFHCWIKLLNRVIEWVPLADGRVGAQLKTRADIERCDLSGFSEGTDALSFILHCLRWDAKSPDAL